MPAVADASSWQLHQGGCNGSGRHDAAHKAIRKGHVDLIFAFASSLSLHLEALFARNLSISLHHDLSATWLALFQAPI